MKPDLPAGAGAPFVIYCPPPGWGFFANFFWMLDGISLADRNGWVPVVDMQRHRTRFNERHAVSGTTNAWEYYFDQPGGVSLVDAESLDARTNEGRFLGEFFWTPVDMDHDARVHGDLAERGRSLVARYIRVRPDVTASVDELLAPGSHDDVLGVHVRGTDMRRATNPDHPIPPEPGAYLDAAVELVGEHGFSKVYLACDEVETVARFRDVFACDLIVSDAFRVSETTHTRRNYRWLFRAKRPLHRYLLGREVLVDALVLARCGTLLCGPSNVALAATFFAESPPRVRGVPPIGVSTKAETWSRHVKRVPMARATAAWLRRSLGDRQRGGPPAT